MRRLVFVRHAKSSWDDESLDDHDRPLAPRGERALEPMRTHVASLDLPTLFVLCSTARRAEATLDRAWELDPRNPQAMAGYARLYIAKKDGARAVKWAKKAVKKRSKRASYHVLYGDALMLQGETAAARRAWRKALSLDPDNRDAKRRLAKSGARAAN